VSGEDARGEGAAAFLTRASEWLRRMQWLPERGGWPRVLASPSSYLLAMAALISVAAKTTALAKLELTEEALVLAAPNPPPFAAGLDAALHAMPESLAGLRNTIAAASPHLHWRVDHGLFYAAGDDVGRGYAEGNMHCELIGPNGTAQISDTLSLGLFYLEPWRLYRDHNYPAGELYLTLTEPSDWRFEVGPWESRPAGSLLLAAGPAHDLPFRPGIGRHTKR